MSKRKLNVKNIKQKYEALIEVERGLKSKLQISRENGIPANTLSTWIKNGDKIKSAFIEHQFLPQCKRMRHAKQDNLEQALLKWFNIARATDTPISGPILKNKANEMATKLNIFDFRCSNGWLERFKKRHGIMFRSLYGEVNSITVNNNNNPLFAVNATTELNNDNQMIPNMITTTRDDDGCCYESDYDEQPVNNFSTAVLINSVQGIFMCNELRKLLEAEEGAEECLQSLDKIEHFIRNKSNASQKSRTEFLIKKEYLPT